MTEMSGKTIRSVEGRLFPNRVWDTGWELSIQADKAGYACSPKERLPVLEGYETVEVVIRGPFSEPVDPAFLDLSPELTAKFTAPEASGVAIGQNLSWADIAELSEALNRAGMNPNAGIPRGDIGWAGRAIFHGTSREAAEDILQQGVRMDASSMGYFGRAFYVTDERALAISNYAMMAEEDDEPALVSATLATEGHILDLRNPLDAQEWAKIADQTWRQDFDFVARRAGISGVYDRSIGGLAIYDRTIVEGIRIDILPSERGPSP